MQSPDLRSVCRFSELADGSITKVSPGDEDMVLVRDGGSVHAFAATCPHAGAPLEQGVVCHHRLICPWHKAIFALDDGAIVDPPALEPLRRYPVHIEGDDVIVSLRAIEPEPRVGPIDGRRVLILGSGAAGTAAAFALRDAGFSGTITMIGDEAMEPYDRTVLSKFVLHDMKPSDVPWLRRDGDWKAQRIDRLEGTIVHLDAESRRVRLSDGTLLDYDAAVLATGATANVPNIPGVNLSGVHPLRNRVDAAFIAAAAAPGGRVVIVGGSFIGLEAASALRQRGMQVTIVMPERIPFQRQFGPEIGTMFRDLHEANGIVFRSGCQVERFDGPDKVAAVTLSTGERLPADLVVLGVGVRPATTFVDGVRKADDGGIVVDATMRAADGLYVAGDSACFPFGGDHLRIEHWRVAQQHGRIAAQNIAAQNIAAQNIAAQNISGLVRQYTGVPFFWTYHFGKRFGYLGHAEHWDELHIDGDLRQHKFVALQLRDDTVSGVIACQRERTTALLIERMREPLPLSEAFDLLRA
jgi:NADPH-dependent 2,4-dienoyl-CoA reductase/sulfur reductase-like enzyme/nitrite reductase/ring-hydroxylating ferredoxin subunit